MNMNEYFAVSEFLLKESGELYRDYFSIEDEEKKTEILNKLLLISKLKLRASEEYSFS